jgi:hypothetical protein
MDNYATQNLMRQTEVFKIVDDGNGRALLLWPTEDALVARWVTLK